MMKNASAVHKTNQSAVDNADAHLKRLRNHLKYYKKALDSETEIGVQASRRAVEAEMAEEAAENKRKQKQQKQQQNKRKQKH